jgi:MbtH protein
MVPEREPEINIVVMNHEEQYSIWPEYKAVPEGWSSVGKTGSKEECLEYIKTVWTDMRPLSLRRQMQAQEQDGSTTSD